VQLSAWRFPEKSGSYWCLIVTDLRDQKLQDALRESEDHLRTLAVNLERRVEERTQELVASHERLRTLAHELNLTEQRERKRMARELHDYPAQLLALAIMHLSQLKQRQGQGPVITDLVYKVHGLIVEALNYTRTLVSDLSPPMLEEIGFLPALRGLAEQMQRHQLTVTVETPQGYDPKIPSEQALMLFQSIRELLINVSKHSGAAEATVSLYQHDGELRIEVRDRGTGFDVNRKTGGVNGINFGLFSIRERMQALGGTFELESSAEEGTRATLVLPPGGANAGTGGYRPNVLMSGVWESTNSNQPSERRRQPRNATPAAKNTRLQSIRVMLVDDHAMVRQGLRSLLEGYCDIEVVGEAANGEEALAAIVTLQPAIVLMDISMPKMNGIQATAAIRDRYPEIVVIGLSVQNGGEMHQAMLQAGAAVLLSKEAAVEQLYQTIQTVQTAIPNLGKCLTGLKEYLPGTTALFNFVKEESL
jgi:signal transduction histidine kinase/CheY-like chemotaxis protein